MKNLFLLFVTLFFVLPLAAQEDDLVKLLSDQTCECLEQSGLSGADMEQMQVKLGVCLLEKAMPYLDRIETELGINLLEDGAAGGEKLGEKIGMRMAVECPVFLNFVEQVMQEGNELDHSDRTVVGTVSGEIAEFKTSGFVNIIIKSGSCRRNTYSYHVLRIQKEG